jgi:hypothetical protein
MPDNADLQIRLYGLLTDQLGKYTAITWQVPTGLVAANILAVDRFGDRPIILEAIGVFNAVIIVAFWKMVVRQRTIIAAARQAEDLLRDQYDAFQDLRRRKYVRHP